MRLKSELYAKEQDNTIDKIIQIIGITEENNTITLELSQQQNISCFAKFHASKDKFSLTIPSI